MKRIAPRLLLVGCCLANPLGAQPPEVVTSGSGARSDPFLSDGIQEDCRDFGPGAYHGVLLRLAEGDRKGAAVELAGLYSAGCFQAGPHDRSFLRMLAKLQELKRRDYGVEACLLPVLYLHLDAAELLLVAGREQSAARSIDAFRRLLLFHRRGLEPGVGLATVMRALGRAGIVLRNAGQLAEARTLFLEAVDLDSEAPPTLHLLGTVDEKLGQYGLAAKYFSRLVEVAAEDPTGRLRLALVESRRGRFDDARRLFEELLVEPVPDWVEAVAFEELARVEIETGHLGKALEVLDAGLQRHPFDQQLVLLRTWLQGDRSEAGRRALAEIRPSSSEQTETSARVRYNEWPTEEVAGFLLRMEEDVASSLPELRRALKLAEIIPRASSGSVEPW